MNGASVQQPRVASGAHRGLHWPRAAQAEAHRIDKLFRVQDGAPAVVQFPKPNVINIRIAEFTRANQESPGALLFVSLLEGGAQTIVNTP